MNNNTTTNNTTTNFDTLYGIDKKGKYKKWDIYVQNFETYSEFVYSYGYIDGKQVVCKQKIEKGKNIGKKNETTHYEQAILEAKSKWNKKKDLEGYSITIDSQNEQKNSMTKNDDIKQKNSMTKNDGIKQKNSMTNKSTQILHETIYPMLAHDYKKNINKLSYPCYIQPKLDGYRMIYNSYTKKCTSRQGKEFDIIKNTDLYKELLQLNENIILDGELYVHNGIFENLGILRKKKLSNNDIDKLNEIEYHIYDIVNTDLQYELRLNELQNLFKKHDFKKLKIVETIKVNREKEIKFNHDNFISNNYEGSILRNITGLYKLKFRSTDLLKYKDFEDNEYKIVDFTFEKNTSEVNEDLIVWICENENGDTFKVRPKGTHEERKMLFKECNKNFNKFKNRNLYVKYFELTDNNIPRFATTKTDTYISYIRDTIE